MFNFDYSLSRSIIGLRGIQRHMADSLALFNFQNINGVFKNKTLLLDWQPILGREIKSVIGNESIQNITNNVLHNIKMPYGNNLQALMDWKVCIPNGIVDVINQFNTIVQSSAEPLKEHVEFFRSLNKEMRDMASAIPAKIYKVLLNGTGYTKKDIVKDLDDISLGVKKGKGIYRQILSDETLGIKEKKEKILSVFYNNHKAAYCFLLVIMTLVNVYGVTQFVLDGVIPFVEDVIILAQGNENKYFISEQRVNVYEFSSCRSKVLDVIYYSEQVKELSDAKMWRKVTYINTDGVQSVGWIAKRNLIPYKDWLFNDD